MENCSPSAMKRLTREICELAQHPLEGIRLLVDEANLTDIQAVIDGPVETPYAGGRFHVRLVMGHSFPEEPPKGFFLTRIFHPNIASPSGEICVNTLKRDWTPDTGLRHLLLVIKCLLIVPNAESALHEEAGRLLLEDYSEYCSRARLFTEIHAMRATTATAAPSSGASAAATATTAATADAGENPVLRDSNDANGSGAAAGAIVGGVGGKRPAQQQQQSSGQSCPAAKRTKKALKRL